MDGDHFLTVVSRDYSVHCRALLSHLWLIGNLLSFFFLPMVMGICILPSNGVLLSILFNDFILICMFYTLERCHLEEVAAEKLMNANISALK